MNLTLRILFVLMLGTLVPGFGLQAATVPVVDATAGESGYRQTSAGASSGSVAGGSSSATLIYKLQLLQQEVQELRGIVEQQQYQITQMREEQRDRYLDLDRRVSLVTQSGVSSGSQIKSDDSNAADSQPAASALVDEKSAYQAAFELIRNKRYDDAINALSRFVADFPNGEYTGNAFYWLGEVQIVKASYQDALQAFASLLNKYPQHRKVADAKYKLGKVYRELGDSAKSERLLKEVIENHAGTTAAKLAEAELRNARL